MPKKTEGELLFEEYLSNRGVGWAYEEHRAAGESRPDYLLKVQPAVLAEIKDFAPTAVDKAIRAVGFRGTDSYSRIRDKIDKAKAKFKQHKGRGLACVLVLRNAGAFVHLSSE